MRALAHSAPPALRHLVALAALALVLCTVPETAGADEMQCEVKDDRIVCDVTLEEFYRQEIRSVLNNGWENTIQFRLVIRDAAEEEVAAITFSTVTQRCYIDPFDDPCLALWSGEDEWDTHEDVDEMIAAIEAFTLVSVPTADLGPGRYTALLETQLNPITDEQVTVIRSWLARHRGGHLVVGKNESSIFGTFVSVFANVRSGEAEATTILTTESFTIE